MRENAFLTENTLSIQKQNRLGNKVSIRIEDDNSFKINKYVSKIFPPHTVFENIGTKNTISSFDSNVALSSTAHGVRGREIADSYTTLSKDDGSVKIGVSPDWNAPGNQRIKLNRGMIANGQFSPNRYGIPLPESGIGETIETGLPTQTLHRIKPVISSLFTTPVQASDTSFNGLDTCSNSTFTGCSSIYSESGQTSFVEYNPQLVSSTVEYPPLSVYGPLPSVTNTDSNINLMDVSFNVINRFQPFWEEIQKVTNIVEGIGSETKYDSFSDIPITIENTAPCMNFANGCRCGFAAGVISGIASYCSVSEPIRTQLDCASRNVEFFTQNNSDNCYYSQNVDQVFKSSCQLGPGRRNANIKSRNSGDQRRLIPAMASKEYTLRRSSPGVVTTYCYRKLDDHLNYLQAEGRTNGVSLAAADPITGYISNSCIPQNNGVQYENEECFSDPYCDPWCLGVTASPQRCETCKRTGIPTVSDRDIDRIATQVPGERMFVSGFVSVHDLWDTDNGKCSKGSNFTNNNGLDEWKLRIGDDEETMKSLQQQCRDKWNAADSGAPFNVGNGANFMITDFQVIYRPEHANLGYDGSYEVVAECCPFEAITSTPPPSPPPNHPGEGVTDTGANTVSACSIGPGSFVHGKDPSTVNLYNHHATNQPLGRMATSYTQTELANHGLSQNSPSAPTSGKIQYDSLDIPYSQVPVREWHFVAGIHQQYVAYFDDNCEGDAFNPVFHDTDTFTSVDNPEIYENMVSNYMHMKNIDPNNNGLFESCHDSVEYSCKNTSRSDNIWFNEGVDEYIPLCNSSTEKTLGAFSNPELSLKNSRDEPNVGRYRMRPDNTCLAHKEPRNIPFCRGCSDRHRLLSGDCSATNRKEGFIDEVISGNNPNEMWPRPKLQPWQTRRTCTLAPLDLDGMYSNNPDYVETFRTPQNNQGRVEINMQYGYHEGFAKQSLEDECARLDPSGSYQNKNYRVVGARKLEAINETLQRNLDQNTNSMETEIEYAINQGIHWQGMQFQRTFNPELFNDYSTIEAGRDLVRNNERYFSFLVSCSFVVPNIRPFPPPSSPSPPTSPAQSWPPGAFDSDHPPLPPPLVHAPAPPPPPSPATPEPSPPPCPPPNPPPPPDPPAPPGQVPLSPPIVTLEPLPPPSPLPPLPPFPPPSPTLHEQTLRVGYHNFATNHIMPGLGYFPINRVANRMDLSLRKLHKSFPNSRTTIEYKPEITPGVTTTVEEIYSNDYLTSNHPFQIIINVLTNEVTWNHNRCYFTVYIQIILLKIFASFVFMKTMFVNMLMNIITNYRIPSIIVQEMF
jgi:hypothetical protein